MHDPRLTPWKESADGRTCRYWTIGHRNRAAAVYPSGSPTKPFAYSAANVDGSVQVDGRALDLEEAKREADAVLSVALRNMTAAGGT